MNYHHTSHRQSLSLSSSPVSAVSLSGVLNLRLSPLSPLKHAPPTRPQSLPPAPHSHPHHHPVSRSSRYHPNSFFGFQLSILIRTLCLRVQCRLSFLFPSAIR